MTVCDVVGCGNAYIVADGGDGEAVVGDAFLDELVYSVCEVFVLLVFYH